MTSFSTTWRTSRFPWWTVFYAYAGFGLWVYLPPDPSGEVFSGHLLLRHSGQVAGLLCLLFVLWDRDRLPVMERASSRWRAAVALAVGILTASLFLKVAAALSALYDAPPEILRVVFPKSGLNPTDVAADVGAAVVAPALFAAIARHSPYAASVAVFVLAVVWTVVHVTFGYAGSLGVVGAGALVALGVLGASRQGGQK